MTGHGSIDEAVQAMRLGAYDFLTKPLDLEHLRLVIERALRERHCRTRSPTCGSSSQTVTLPERPQQEPADARASSS